MTEDEKINFSGLKNIFKRKKVEEAKEENSEESKEEQKWYKSNLYQIKNINLSLYAPEWSIIQRVLSLQDHSYFPVIHQIAQGRNTVGSWKLALRKIDSTLDKEAGWKYDVNDSLPWDNITHILEKKTLVSSFIKYLEIMNCT